jgi:hypothetical protein
MGDYFVKKRFSLALAAGALIAAMLPGVASAATGGDLSGNESCGVTQDLVGGELTLASWDGLESHGYGSFDQDGPPPFAGFTSLNLEAPAKGPQFNEAAC